MSSFDGNKLAHFLHRFCTTFLCNCIYITICNNSKFMVEAAGVEPAVYLYEGSGSFYSFPTTRNLLIFNDKIALDISFCNCYE